MKVTTKDTQETINISSITREHTVVFLFARKTPYLLTASSSIVRDGFKFIRLLRPTESKQIGIYRGPTVQACVKRAIEYGQEIHVFAEWQEAFKWLVDNSK